MNGIVARSLSRLILDVGCSLMDTVNAAQFNADRRDKIPKLRRRVTNYTEYDESLRRRGDLTDWISDDALARCGRPHRARHLVASLSIRILRLRCV